LASQILPGIQLNELNALPSKWITDKNRVIIIQGPDKEGLVYPTEEQVLGLLASVEKEKLEPYVDKVSNKPLMAKDPKPSKVVKESKIESVGVVEWVLANGVKVVLKPTDFKDDEILMTAYSKGGSSLYPVSQNLSANFATSVIGESGLSEFDNIELQKALSGKMVQVSPFIRELQEGFSGSSSKADLETLLQLTYLSFTAPRADDKTFGSFINRMKGFLENSSLNPENAFNDTITVTMANYSPYRKPLNVQRLAEADLRVMDAIYKERFIDANNFTFFFVGSLDLVALKPLVEKYLGGLPSIKRDETWKDVNIKAPKGIVKKTVVKDMEDAKATVYIALSGNYTYDPMDRIALSAINDILSFRYVETIREEESGTYGASVYTSQSKYPNPSYQLNIRFDCDPLNAEKLSGIVLAEIEKLRTQGPDEKQLNNFIENKAKTRAEGLKENSFWNNALPAKDFDAESYESILTYDTMLKNLSLAKIKECAQKYYDGSNIVQVTLMPSDMTKSVNNPNMKN
jgi:zinc protease